MSFQRYGMTFAGMVGLVAVILAGATIWLLLTDPATVADAVSEQSISPVVRELAGLLYEALRRLLRYL
jgi:hypothetical protein